MSAHRPFLVACHLVLLKDDKVLLLRRFHTGFEDGNYHLPAGHVEWNETAAAGMRREAEEEIGIKLSAEQLQPLFVMHRKADDEDIRVDYFFKATEWTGEVCNQEPNKCDDVQWFAFDDLPPNMVQYARDALSLLDKGQWYLEYGW